MAKRRQHRVQTSQLFNKMVVGTLVDMGGEVVYQSAVAVGTICNALYIGTFGPADKQPRKPSPREPSPRKPSPRVASPSAMLGGGAHAVAASPREEEQLYVEQEHEKQAQVPPQYGESPASTASFFSLPQQHAQPRGRGIAGTAPGGFDTKMEGDKHATFPGGFETQAMQEQDEPYHLHHPSLHLPTNEGEEGMAAEPGPKGGRPRSGPLSRRSASSSGHVKQVKCSVM